MRSSNFVLGGMTRAAAQGTATAPYGGQPGYGQPGYGYGPQPGGYPPAAPPQVVRAMTIDDVVVRTVGLLAVTGVVAALSWILLPPTTYGIALFGSMITGLILVLAISFMQITNPFVIGAYAVVEGVFLGVVSAFFEQLFPGIVLQAVVGTFGVFALMAALYKSRVIRATPFFRKAVIGALLGAMALMLVNFVFAMFGSNLGLFNNPADGQQASWLMWLVGIGMVVLAALTFILDFDMVEQGVRAGLDQKYAWYASFGLLVGLIFLYLQLLRLIAMFRE